MLNWLLIIAVLLVIMALKLTKFISIALISALLVMLVVNQIRKSGNKDHLKK